MAGRATHATKQEEGSTSRRYRVLFYDPDHLGHHMPYLARMLPGFLDRRVELVLATTAAALESREYRQSLGGFADDLRVLPICTMRPGLSPLRNARHRLAELEAAIREAAPDHVAVLYGDGLWQLVAGRWLARRRCWPESMPVEMWLYRGGFVYPDASELDAVKRWLFRRLLRSGLIARLHLDDELLFDYAKAHLAKDVRTQLVLTPNPVTMYDPMTKEDARRELGLPIDGKLVSTSGTITVRKGVDLVLKAYAGYLTKHADAGIRLLVAGPQNDEMRRIIACEPYQTLVASGRIIPMDRWLNERDMFTIASASDLVLAAYPHHSGRSSIILWAAAAGRPSLGASRGCIGYVIRQERLGWTCDVGVHTQFVASLAAALRNEWPSADSHRVRQYAQTHDVKRYQVIASELVKQRLATQS